MSEEHDTWIKDAKLIIQHIPEGSVLTGKYKDVEKEAMPHILESIEELERHLDDFPDVKVCQCSTDPLCPGYDLGWAAGNEYAFPDEPKSDKEGT
ncbi:hypothetical protein LCGC14_1056080 [marine sediment metagenome]|uniref:Uncharacterized protein n=1 Tax=marine sediment metagenome TaxID=412755 RepID=A0A0F9MMH0_9ZZZZ